MARVAVAGAAGFVGSHVCERLCRVGHEVVAIDRPGADLGVAREAGARGVSADLRDPAAAQAALEGVERVVNATGLFDLAASEAALEDANVALTGRVITAARQAGARRVVHVSSTAVYGRPARTPMPEEGPLGPTDAYQRSKRRGEEAARAAAGSALELVVLRPTLVYGPRGRYGLAMMMALSAQARALGVRRLPLLRGGFRAHHVHVEDVARAVEALVASGDAAGRTFNVADDAPLPAGDALVAIARAFDLRVLPPRLRVAWPLVAAALGSLPEPALRATNRRLGRGHAALVRRGRAGTLVPRVDRDWLAYLCADHVYDTRALRALGVTPAFPDVRRALPAVIAWYRRAGWLATPAEREDGAPRRDARRTDRSEKET